MSHNLKLAALHKYTNNCNFLRGHKFDPGLLPYLHVDLSGNIFYGHLPPSPDSRNADAIYK